MSLAGRKTFKGSLRCYSPSLARPSWLSKPLLLLYLLTLTQAVGQQSFLGLKVWLDPWKERTLGLMVGRGHTASLTDLLGVDPHTRLCGMLMWYIYNGTQPFEVARGEAERSCQFCFRHPCAAAVTGLMITVEKTDTQPFLQSPACPFHLRLTFNRSEAKRSSCCWEQE